LDLELQRNFSLEKSEGWDSVAMEVVRDACDPVKKADVWAVVMQEGLANLAVLTGARTVLKQRVEVTVPRKRGGGAGNHDQVRHWTILADSIAGQYCRKAKGGEGKPA
jgi:protein pelota